MTRIATIVSAALLLAGCASTLPPDHGGDQSAETTQPLRFRDPRAAAYYYYSVAQMNARAGRLQEAIAALRGVLERDPDSSELWGQLAQWLARTNDPVRAIEAAQKAAASSR